MKGDLKSEIVLPPGVTAQLQGAILKVRGAKGEVVRNFIYPKISINVKNGKIILFSAHATKREKKILYTFDAHIKNMVEGVQNLHVYKLKICSGHFPMNVAVSGNNFVVKNFLGEAVPRKTPVLKNVDIKINGTEIVVSGVDREVAGQMAASIENLCRITNKDIRIFQDGCYIVQKAGKKR